jgi:Tse2 ADP-ribosyltransferase toxins
VYSQAAAIAPPMPVEEFAMSDKTTVNLFRSIHKTTPGFEQGPIVDDKAVIGVLYPDFETRDLGSGRTRAADVKTFRGEGGVTMVRTGGGTSLFDRAFAIPGGTKFWHCFKIPKDTVIPDSLIVRFTDRNEKFNANHYQIEVKTGTMSVDAMKGALDNMARNAIVRLVELGDIKPSVLVH